MFIQIDFIMLSKIRKQVLSRIIHAFILSRCLPLSLFLSLSPSPALLRYLALSLSLSLSLYVLSFLLYSLNSQRIVVFFIGLHGCVIVAIRHFFGDVDDIVEKIERRRSIVLRDIDATKLIQSLVRLHAVTHTSERTRVSMYLPRSHM